MESMQFQESGLSNRQETKLIIKKYIIYVLLLPYKWLFSTKCAAYHVISAEATERFSVQDYMLILIGDA